MKQDRLLKLSFVIPVYNSEATLKDCVFSIISQQKTGIEIILVDDGSAPACARLCDELCEQYPECIKVIHQKNAGSLAARVNGTKTARGEYVLYVDADDMIFPNAVQHILQDTVSQSDLYLYDYVMDYVGGEEYKLIKVMEYSEATCFRSENKKAVSAAFMKGKMNTVCATAIKREVLLAAIENLPDEKIKNGEDRLQKMFLIIHAETITYIPYHFYHYKWYPNSQGQELRSGRFSMQIYKDFQTIWPIERENYGLMGFDEKEEIQYDLQKLNRVCKLLERSYLDKSMGLDELKALIDVLANDDLFLLLAHPGVLCHAGCHIKITAKLIKAGNEKQLHRYWNFCSLLRKIKHSIIK